MKIEPAIDSYADREWDRFFACAIPTPNGLGLYDPINGAPAMPSGVSGERWDALVADFAGMGKAVRP